MAQQQLPDKFPIVDDDGNPTPYFIRFLQTIGGTIDGKPTEDQVKALIAAWAAGRHINTTLPIQGGGSLSADLTLALAASGVTPGTYGDATHVGQFTVDSHGLITAASNVAITGGGGGGGALVLLEQYSLSGASSANFTNSISSTYDDYMIEFIDVVTTTNAVDLLMRVSTNGGVSYDSSTNYQFSYAQVAQSGFLGGVGSTGDSGFVVLNSYSNAASNGISGTLKFYGPGNSLFKRVIFDTTAYKSDGNFYRNAGAGRYIASTTPVNAFQFLFRSGTIASGTIRCYGIAKIGGGGSSTPWNRQTAVGTGASQNITLSSAPISGGLLMVFVNGIKYQQTTDYTVSGTTLTLTTNASGDAIEVIWQ